MGGAVARIVKPRRSTPTPVPAPVPAPTPLVSPTAPEVSQATATSMDGYDARKTKSRGRSITILTGAKGVEEETLTLGRKSLLGR